MHISIGFICVRVCIAMYVYNYVQFSRRDYHNFVMAVIYVYVLCKVMLGWLEVLYKSVFYYEKFSRTQRIHTHTYTLKLEIRLYKFSSYSANVHIVALP